ncbi:MAG: chloride channel protein [Melioribacter sp.]|uniref:chloride channel protein n=1 Tax=Rosettibacter primus TaxID=3111523 RepID=UPI00247E1FA9|nr:chloride channel protein [Melioribacter sp.]
MNKEIIKKFFSQTIRNDFTLNIIYAVATGIIVGLSAVLFHNSIEFFNELFFHQTASGLFFLGAAAVIIIPAIGMLIQSVMIFLSPEYASKKGVTEVIKAVALNGNRIPFRSTIFNFLASVISIGSGNTVGPEGPAARLGGGIANKFAFVFKLPDNKKSILTAAGAGAAISAIFNTPIGGIFFALEIILLNEFSTTSVPILILSSISASAISRTFLGNESIFVFHSPNPGSYLYLYHYALLGVLAGIISFAFVSYSNKTEKIFSRILKKIPQWIVMTSIGLLVGITGYFYKYIFGIGYNGINQILSGSLTFQVVLILLVLKFILVPLILNSGGFGGIFAPSLFIGACSGYLYGSGLNYLLGNQFDVTAFVLVGMGAVLGGINFIPISAILIIFEMTKDYSFILPLMLAVVTSTMFVQLTLKKSIHERYLEQQGYRISTTRDIKFRLIPVKSVMRKDIVLISEDTLLPHLIKDLIESKQSVFYVVDKEGNLNGYISESELKELITEYESIRDILVARDISKNKIVTVLEDDTLDEVLKLFEIYDINEIPVISADKKKVLGTISRNDIIAVYNKENLRAEIIEQLSFNLLKLEKVKRIKVFEGYSIIEKIPPQELIGKTLSQLDFRKNFGLEILMIKKDFSKNENIVFPHSNYVIEKDDKLILFGKDEDVDNFENL